MKIIANGGYAGSEANTLDALLLTRNINYFDGVMVDVRKSKDDVLVLATYNDLIKNTLSNKKVSESNYHILRKIKFPSHIFKYYIPKLSEFLEKYQSDKIILLYLHDVDNHYLNLLYDVLIKYHYNYYYLLDNLDMKKIKQHALLKIGKLCDNYLFANKIDKYINEDIFVITKK